VNDLFRVSFAHLEPDEILGDQSVVAAGCDGAGRLPAGALCLLADLVLGMVSCSRLGESERLVTSVLSLEFVGPLEADGLSIGARASVVGSGAASILSTATLTRPDGSLVAQATGRFPIVPAGGTVAAWVKADAGIGEPDGAVSPAPHALTDGVPIHELLRTRITAAGDGRVAFEVRSDPAFANERGGLHGGMGGLIAERGTDLAVAAAVSPGTDWWLGSLRVVFVRPLPAAGQRVAVEAEVRNLGRTQAMTRAHVLTADGKLAIAAEALYTLDVQSSAR
jgi:uncharacterized protein (TIGR00369 family)